MDADEEEEAAVRYLWHRCDYGRLSEALKRIDWELKFMYLPVKLAYEVLLSLLNDLIAIYVSTCSPHEKITWSATPPKSFKFARSDAWKTYKELRARFGKRGGVVDAALNESKQFNYQLRHYVRDSRAQYEQQLIDELSTAPKRFHFYIRSKKKGRMSVGPLKLPNGQLIFDPEGVANYLAETFASVFIGNVPASPAQYQTYNGVMPEVVITVNRVKDVLLDLNVNSAV